MRGALLRAAGVSGLVLALGLATRGGSTDVHLMWLVSTIQMLGMALSAPALLVLRAFHLTSGDYLSNRDLALLTVLNLAFWTAFFLWLRRPRRIDSDLPDASRRALLWKGAAVGGAVVAVGVLASEKERLEVVSWPLPVADLPSGLEGMRIAVASDMHRGPFNSMDFLVRAMREVDAQKPDVVLLPGDFVHVSGEYFAEAAEAVSLVKAPVFGTLGNHDHWEGADSARRELGRVLTLLDNRRVFLVPGGGVVEEIPSEGLLLGGVGDLWEDMVDLDGVLAGAPPRMPRLVLSHNPDFAEAMAESRARVDLQVSGHTHGGQVSLPGVGVPFVPSRYGNRYAQGLVQGPRWPVYVSRGLGTTILPLRFRVRPEITVFELRRA